MIGSSQSGNLGTILFIVFVAGTLVITAYAARKASTASGFFAAGRRMSAVKNGFAINGDYMSASSFLGIAGLVALFGFDGLTYSFGFIVGWLVILLLVAEPLRNIGKYTLADVMDFRLGSASLRSVAAVSTLVTVLFYLLAQLVAVDTITRLLLPINPSVALAGVGALMIVYVLVGGMVSITYIQIVKAFLLLTVTTALTIALVSRFGFNLSSLLGAAAERSGDGSAFLEPGLYFTKPIDLISLGLALALGAAGLPHVMARFYTVPTARAARTSALWVIGPLAGYMLMTTVLGFGAAAVVGGTEIGGASQSGNSATPLLALRLAGGADTVWGNVVLAVICAIVFATIIAVVAGLTIAGATTIAHDLFSKVIFKGAVDEQRDVRIARIATLALGTIAIVLAFAVKSLNVAFLASLAFTVGASANLPVILYSLFWKRFNKIGAIAAIVVGIVSTLTLVAIGPSVIGVKGLFLHDVDPIFPLSNPGIITIPLGFLAGWLGSVITRPSAQSGERFRELRLRELSGYGAEPSTASH
ncbi:solute symporter family protein [Rhodococcus opacus]|uniref:solute symporter family protein n=1 Tax=Rhodococcus opacus TaxID=37919 RepID=UPI000EA9A0CD|nr:cation acetate symporter [Rhodococcus opacus]QZS52576.1 cation acetate symporter [Rhodococcus opacus]RKM64878.1 cation acetate symporter [Rhodococcus opacus]